MTVLSLPPAAGDDEATTLENTSVTVAVLANDHDAYGGAVTLGSVTAPAHGTATIDGARVIYAPETGFFGDDTFTYTVIDRFGVHATATVHVSVSRRGRFVALGVEELRLRDGVRVVSGDVGANAAAPQRPIHWWPRGWDGHPWTFGPRVALAWMRDLAAHAPRRDDDYDRDDRDTDTTVEVRLDRNVRMLQPSSRVVGDTVRLNDRATVYDVASNELLQRRANILGSTTSPVVLPFLELPDSRAVTPSSERVTIARRATRTLDAGRYGRVRVRRGATLVLTGGVYEMESLELDQLATVVVRGAVELRIRRELATASRARLMVDPGVPGLSASDVVVYVLGGDDACEHRGDREFEDGDDDANGGRTPTVVHIGEQNVIQANVYAPGGTLRIKARTQATGAFFGLRVRVDRGVRLTLDSAFE